MSEEEIYFEQGKKMVELGCFACPQKLYAEYPKYVEFLLKNASNCQDLSKRAKANMMRIAKKMTLMEHGRVTK